MVIKSALQIGNPLLRKKSKKVEKINSSEVQQIIESLINIMRRDGLIGEAAPQIGKSLRIFVTEVRKTKYRRGNSRDELKVYINPEIISFSKKKVVGYEGCGSVIYAQLFGPVKRSEKVKIRAKNENGKEFVLEADGLLARVIQHEYDHLEGVLFTDKIDNWTKIMAREEYFKMKNKKKN